MKSEVVRVDDLVCGGTEHTCTVYLFPPALHRLDNLIFARSHPEVKAVLDWELSTLGDPVSDLAYACIPYHMEPGLPHLKGGKSIASTFCAHISPMPPHTSLSRVIQCNILLL